MASKNTLPFTLAGAARISTLSPTSVAAGSVSFTLYVSGVGFGTNSGSSSVIQWNGTPLATTISSSTYIFATVPAVLLVPGSVTITVVTGSLVSNGVAFTVTSPVPSVSNLNPPAVDAGGPAVTVSITGTGFMPASVASLAGTPLATTYVNATTLSVSVASNLRALCGSYDLVVANPGGVNSSAFKFVVNPVLAAVNPAWLPIGTSDTTITITGVGFQPGLVVSITSPATVVGLRLATTYVSSTTLTVLIPAEWLYTPKATVIGFATGLSTGPSLPLNIGTPTITSLNPASIAVGAPSFTLTVNGTGLSGTPSVQWNGGALATTVVNPTQLAAAIPGSLLAAPGTVAITVLNGAASNSLSFLITPAGGSITALQPDHAAAGGPAFTLTVTGGGFVSATQVVWNETALVTAIVSSTQVTAAVPASLLAVAGTARITVTAGGQVSAPGVFTVLSSSSSPTITAVTNAASFVAAFAPGSLMTVFGENLAVTEATPPSTPLPTTLGDATVTINGVPVPLLYVGPGQINAQIPFEIPTGAASLQISTGVGHADSVPLKIAASAPGVLQDAKGHAIAQNAADYSLNSPANPAQTGTYLVVYLTGQGLLDIPVASGAAAPGTPLSRPLADVTATIGGQPATVAFAGLTPGLVGVCQLNLLVPSVPSGELPLAISVGGVASNQTTVSIQQ